jgi:hypothetical protein
MCGKYHYFSLGEFLMVNLSDSRLAGDKPGRGCRFPPPFCGYSAVPSFWKSVAETETWSEVFETIRILIFAAGTIAFE